MKLQTNPKFRKNFVKNSYFCATFTKYGYKTDN